MSNAAAQFQQLVRTAVREGRVFTFEDDGAFLAYKVDKETTMPFWSSRSRMELIRKRLPEYRAYAVAEVPLEAFCRKLNELRRQKVLVGCNWSGPRLRGYNLPAASVRKWLVYYRENGPDAPVHPESIG